MDPLTILGVTALGAIGDYLTAKSQSGAQERGWQYQLELEKLRIQAQKELEQMRNRIDPDIYARLKKELLQPSSPRGYQGKTGTFRQLLGEQGTPPTQTVIPPQKIPTMGGGQNQLYDYFNRGVAR